MWNTQVTDGIIQIDQRLFLFLNSFHSPFLNSLMSFLSGQLVWLPLLGYFFWYSIKKNGKSGTIVFSLFLFLTIIASDVTSSYILKNVFERLRPCRQLDLIPLIYSFGQKCGGKYGFVSSHAANSMALILFSIRVLPLDKKLTSFFFIIPLLVGFSRIYLGVHFPGDILGGFAVGAIWSIVLSFFYQSAQGANRKNSH